MYKRQLLAQESGEYTEAKAYEVMTKMLNEYEDINFVYCENDNEAFGVIAVSYTHLKDGLIISVLKTER